MVTIRDVAKKCGYSVRTVSRILFGEGYLKGETKQKILEVAAELGYRPNTLAANLRVGRRQVLTLVLPSLTNTYYTRLGQYLESYVPGRGYIICLNNTKYSLEKERQILENLTGIDIAGAIITPVTSQHDHIMNLTKYDIPYVYLNRSFKDDMEHCLRLDNRKTVYEVVSYVIRLGYRNIGGIFQSFDSLTYRKRYDGMAQTLREHGPDCRPGYMLLDINLEDMGTIPGRILRLLQKVSRPETIFACNDMTAFNIYRACYIPGLRTPGHLSVLDYGNYIVAGYVTPPLPTINVPVHKLAGTAIDFIHGYLKPGVRVELPTLKASLITRNSMRNLNLD